MQLCAQKQVSLSNTSVTGKPHFPGPAPNLIVAFGIFKEGMAQEVFF